MTKLERQKLISEWFERGYRAGKRDNPSGCCCEIEDDRIVSYCAVHAADRDRLMGALRMVISFLKEIPVDHVPDNLMLRYIERADEMGV